MLTRLVLLGVMIGLYVVSPPLAWVVLAGAVVFAAWRMRRSDATDSILQQ